MDFLHTLSYLLINIIIPLSIISILVLLVILIRHLLILIANLNVVSKDIEHKLELLSGPVETMSSVNNKYISFMTTFNAAIFASKGLLKIRKKIRKK